MVGILAEVRALWVRRGVGRSAGVLAVVVTRVVTGRDRRICVRMRSVIVEPALGDVSVMVLPSEAVPTPERTTIEWG